MGVLRRLLEMAIDITRRIDEEVEKGYDLNSWGDQMKFLHALQIQSQILIDTILRSCATLGHAPSTPVDAARYLVEKGIISKNEFEFFRKVLSFRNIVVHQYASVDMNIVDKILRNREYRKVLQLVEKVFNAVSRIVEDP